MAEVSRSRWRRAGRKRPDQYEHVWEGDFVTVVAGAYYADALASAKRQGRIARVAVPHREPDEVAAVDDRLLKRGDLGGVEAEHQVTTCMASREMLSIAPSAVGS